MLVLNGGKYFAALTLCVIASSLAGCSSGDKTATTDQNTGVADTPSTPGISNSSSATSISSASSASMASSTSSVTSTSSASSTSMASSTSSASSTVSTSSAATLGISGLPVTAVMVNSNYAFMPTTTGTAGRTVAFSIQGKPNWATFNTLNGGLTGVPTTTGMYAGITISVSDGASAATLNSFDVTVAATATAAATSGGTTLVWSIPTQNDDGTALTGLTSYRIHYGTNSSSLTSTINIASSAIMNYSVSGLVSGTTYYFAITTVNSAGQESVLSNIATQVI